MHVCHVRLCKIACLIINLNTLKAPEKAVSAHIVAAASMNTTQGAERKKKKRKQMEVSNKYCIVRLRAM